ncbi:hypothetical protein, partial [Chryseobacterium pennipullorum]
QTPTIQQIKIEGFGSFNSRDCTDSPNMGNRHKIDLKVKDLQNNQIVQLHPTDSQGNYTGMYSFPGVSFSQGSANYYSFMAQAGKSYQLSLFANWECTNGSVNFKYYDQAPTQVKKNIITGGNRVARLIDSDGNQQLIKRYYYASKDNLNQSSGDKGPDPFYKDFRKWKSKCIDAPPLRDAVITSSSIYPLFNSGKSNVYYKYVTVSLGGDNFEKGGIEKEYTVKRDYWGNQLFGSENVGSAPWTNLGWSNGYLKTEKFFDHNSKILKVNDYTWEKKNVTNNKSYYVRKNYTENNHKPVTYTCNSADIIRPHNNTYWVCTTNHNHHYRVSDWKCILLDANNVEKSNPNHCYQKPLGYQLVHQYAIE